MSASRSRRNTRGGKGPSLWPAVLIALAGLFAAAGAVGAEPVRLAVLKFGTVNWELDVIKTHGLDRAEGISLEVLGLASKNATGVALQAGEVDIIVTDWIWVSRQRAEGVGYTFVPFSTAAGAVMVPAASPVHGLGDLKGKRLGIAGGPLDKSWLLLRGLTQRNLGFDADRDIDKAFAAPPLLNEQILAGRLDAVLNFWHYTARLEAAGLRRVMGVDEITRALGADSPIPLIGFVFDDDWAEANREQVMGLLRASRKAKALLRESDAEWERLRPLMKAKDEATFRALRDGYRRGIPESWGAKEQADAERIFRILAEQGGAKLVGRSKVLQDGTFWPHFSY
ncbi:MAG: ABC transporter substrate-binding protein [Rhodospirillales bacterium]|nr:ABC transporter substrate-binding protein [Rhodospirillales bacterium]